MMSNSSSKIHQTWCADFSRSLYIRASVTIHCVFYRSMLFSRPCSHLLYPAEMIDLLKGLIIAVCVYAMTYIDTSMMYHIIKSQSVIKLYLFYNMLEVSLIREMMPFNGLSIHLEISLEMAPPFLRLLLSLYSGERHRVPY